MKWWWKVLIVVGVILILLGFVGAYKFGVFSGLNKYVDNTPNKNCVSDSDCKMKRVDCGGCGSYDAVNKDWEVSCPFGRLLAFCARRIESKAICVEGTCGVIRPVLEEIFGDEQSNEGLPPKEEFYTEEHITRIKCDAMSHCPADLECYQLEGKPSPLCVDPNPGEWHCDGKGIVLESYPPQLRCESGETKIITVGDESIAITVE